MAGTVEQDGKFHRVRRTPRLPAAVLLAAVTVLAWFPLVSNDLWWHLAAGRFMADSGSLPTADPFSHASEPVPWVNHAWLFDLVLYGVQQAAGTDTLVLVRGVLVAALALVLWNRRRRGEDVWVALAWVAFLLAATRHRMMVRPELAALVLFALLLALWRGEHRRRVLLSALLLLVWVNTHASFLLGLAALGLLATGEALERRSWRPLAASAPVFLVPLLNPFGIRAYLAPLQLMRELRHLPVINPEWMAPPLPHLAPQWVAVIAGAVLFAVGVMRGENRHRLAAAGLLLLGLAVMAATSIRHAGFFAVGAALLVPPLRGRALASGLGLLAAVSFLWQVHWVQQPGSGIHRGRFPVAALAVTDRLPPPGRLYNHPDFGGYLIWALYPHHQVFADGRNELYLDLLPRLNAARADLVQWNHLLAEHGIGWAILPYEGETTVIQGQRVRQMPASWARFPPWEWALVAWDDAAMVFYARPPGRTVPGELHFNPESFPYLAEQIRLGEWRREEVLDELARVLSRDAENRRAQRLLAMVAGLQTGAGEPPSGGGGWVERHEPGTGAAGDP